MHRFDTVAKGLNDNYTIVDNETTDPTKNYAGSEEHKHIQTKIKCHPPEGVVHRVSAVKMTPLAPLKDSPTKKQWKPPGFRKKKGK